MPARYEYPKKPKLTFSRVIDVLMRPTYASLGAMREVLQPRPGVSVTQAALRGIRGKEKVSGREIAQILDLPAPRASGFLLEMFGDPLYWISPTLFKAGWKGVGGLTSKGAKFMSRQLGKFPAGQTTVRSVERAKYNLGRMFIPYYGLPPKMRALAERYGLQRRVWPKTQVDRAVKLSKQIDALPAAERALIPTLIERPAQVTQAIHPEARQIAGTLKKYFQALYRLERKTGIAVERFPNYFPHIIAPEAKKALTAVSKFKGAGKIWTPRHSSLLHRHFGMLQYRDRWGKTKILPLSTKGIGKRIRQLMKQDPRKATWNIRYNTVEEINRLAREGRLKILQGRKVPEFFITDPAMVMAVRGMRPTGAVTNRRFLYETMQTFGKNVDEAPKNWIRSPLIESLSIKASRTGLPFVGKELRKLRFDPEVVVEIDRVYRTLTMPDELRGVMGIYDSVLGWWKMWTLAPIPGYHMRNSISNIFQNYLGGVTTIDPYVHSYSIMKGKKGWVAGVSYGKIRKLLQKQGITGRGFTGIEAAEQVSERLAKPTILVPGRRHIAVRIGREIGEHIEDHARIAHFVDKITKGMKKPGAKLVQVVDDAAKSTRKYLFDYSELTTTERTVFRRLFPFYTWTRKNIPLQLEAMATQPGRWLLFAKGKRAIELDEGPDERFMPQWMKESYQYAYEEIQKDKWNIGFGRTGCLLLI